MRHEQIVMVPRQLYFPDIPLNKTHIRTPDSAPRQFDHPGAGVHAIDRGRRMRPHKFREEASVPLAHN